MNQRLKMAEDNGAILQVLIDSCETRQKELDDREVIIAVKEEQNRELERTLRAKQQLLNDQQEENSNRRTIRRVTDVMDRISEESELEQKKKNLRRREELLAMEVKEVEEKRKKIETKAWYLFEMPKKNSNSKMVLPEEMKSLMLQLKITTQTTTDNDLLKKVYELIWEVYFDQMKKARTDVSKLGKVHTLTLPNGTIY